jgi:hypothetical protein
MIAAVVVVFVELPDNETHSSGLVLLRELIHTVRQVLFVLYLFEVVVYGRAMDYSYYSFLLSSSPKMVLDEQYQIVFL